MESMTGTWPWLVLIAAVAGFGVGYSFGNLPKPDLIPLASPFPLHRGQMLGVYPIRFLDLIGD